MLRGDAIRRGEYIQHSVFRQVANYTSESGLVSLVSQSIGAGPCNIVLRQLPESWPGKICIESDKMIYDATPVQLEAVPVYCSDLSLEEKSTNLSVMLENLQFVVNQLTDQAHEKSLAFVLKAERVSRFVSSIEQAFVQRVESAIDLWKTGAYSLAMKTLQGSGFGLTPSGDDFNAGLMTGFHLLKAVGASRFKTPGVIGCSRQNYQQIIQEAKSVVYGGNPLANSILYHAAAGRVTARQRGFIHELFAEERQQLTVALDEILTTGETSGADWLTGFVFIVEKEITLWLSSAE